MKLTLYMAISIDGLITRGENDSDWVSETDWNELDSFMQSNDAVIMGKHTMEQFGEDFPIEGPTNIVLTHDKTLHRQDGNLIITEGTPTDIIQLASSKGWNNLLLIGGENLNSQFAKSNLIDEIILSVHPLAIGNGLSILGRDPLNLKLEPISTKIINNELIQIIYKVV